MDLIAEMRKRDQIGRERYGTPLQPHNGRKALRDAFEELLDAAGYFAQDAIEKNEPLKDCIPLLSVMMMLRPLHRHLRGGELCFFVRVYCPEVMIGPAHTVDEIYDDATVVQTTTQKLTLAAVVESPKEVITESGEVITTSAPVEKPTSDMLAGLLTEIEKRAGLPTFYEQQNIDDMVIANMSKPARSKLCSAANAFLNTLKQDAGEQ